jgi:lysophospholipase L1-like esterase
MHSLTRSAFTALAIVLSTLFAVVTAADPEHSAVKPVPRDQGWMARHEKFNVRAKQGDVDLVFIGDSITEAWDGPGKEAWTKHYSGRKAMGLGIGGDRTQHVLWRLDNGNIDGIKPKVAVLMIGTNNSNRDDNTAEEIADGITAIVKKLQTKLPETKILLLGIFPRAEKPNAQREKIEKVNEIVSKLDDGKSVHYLDIKDKFLEPDGSISKEIMPDYLHLSPKGYAIWAEAIEPKLSELLGEQTAS